MGNKMHFFFVFLRFHRFLTNKKENCLAVIVLRLRKLATLYGKRGILSC